MQKLWTTNEVAQFLGITELDVEHLVRQGQLTGYKLGGQFLRFRPEQVETLKHTAAVHPRETGKPVWRGRDAWPQQAKDFFYFYDFYVISASFLAVLVIYLIAA